MELESNSIDWNGNELEHKLELEDMERTTAVAFANGFTGFLSHKI